MHAHILSLHTPSTPEVGSKGQNNFKLKVVMLHSKLKGMEHRAPCKHIFGPYTPLHPQMGSKGQNIFLYESSHVAYQIKGNRA